MTFFLTVLLSVPAFSDIAVVVNLENNQDLSMKYVRNIYLGKLKAYPNGEKIEAFDLPIDNRSRDEFRIEVLRKSEAVLHSYWARMLFSSKAKPPKVLPSASEIKEAIAENPNAIAYLDVEDVDASVKVLFRVKG